MTRYRIGQMVQFQYSIEAAIIGYVCDVNEKGIPLVDWYDQSLPKVWFVGDYLKVIGEPHVTQQEGGKP